MQPVRHLLSAALFLSLLNACATKTNTVQVEVPVCPTGQTKCGDLCVSTNTDNLHCGSCETTCGGGDVCDGAGKCALSCQIGLLACGGTCTDPKTSRTHCGATTDCAGTNAGATCGAGEICDNGQCVATCSAGLVACDDTCVDPKTNALHCGAGDDCSKTPGSACEGGPHASPICVDGGCRLACVAGYADCDGVAANGCETQGICAGACTFRDAEHPTYTTPAQDVALCGNTYTPDNIKEACSAGWHVCLLSEWQARYPAGQTPGGTLSTWGASQAERCIGDNLMWEADRPEDGDTYNGDVCNDPNDPSVGSYNPWNNGKFLYDNDGTTIMKGSGDCCDWDTTFEPTTDTDSFAVYCCR